MQLHQLLPHLLHTFKSESDLVKAIEELSLKFTQKRERIGDYLQDERLTSAYTAFFLSTNVPKLEAVFKWLPPSWLDQVKKTAFVDIGAGPGTFSIAFREWIGAPVEAIQVETSAVMRAQAKKLWEGLYPGETLNVRTDSPKTLFFGHSANEMGPEAALKYIRDYAPEHILFVEPGTKDFFPQMLKIREALIQEGFEILYPCPTKAACPLKNSSEDWCHQFLHVEQESDVERLSQLAKKDRRHLPIMVHAFSRSFKTQNPRTRIVRVFPETKFSFEWEVCEANIIHRYQVMKRGLSKPELKILSETLAGTALEVEVEKVLEKSKRVRVLRLDDLPFGP